MKLKAKEQVKVLLSQEGIKQKDLANFLSENRSLLFGNKFIPKAG